MNKIKIALVVVCVLFIFMGCSKESEEGIEIGIIMPVTGPGAVAGKPSFNAAKMVIDSYNENRKESEPILDLILEDDQLDAKTGVSAFQKLISVDKVKAVIGPISSGVALAIAPIAEKNKTVIIATGASNYKISEAGDYIFRVELSDFEGGREQARIAVSKLNFKKIACIFINNDYGVGLMENFRTEFDSLGGKIILSEGYEKDEKDFKTILLKIKSANPDAIFFIFNTEIINFVEQKYQLNIPGKIFTTPVFEDQKYLDGLGKLAEGILYVYYGTFNSASSSNNSKNFVKKYKEIYNDAPNYYAALAFDATSVLVKALKNASFNTSILKDEIVKIKNFEGATGVMSFDENGDVTKPVTLKTVKEGKFVEY